MIVKGRNGITPRGWRWNGEKLCIGTVSVTFTGLGTLQVETTCEEMLDGIDVMLFEVNVLVDGDEFSKRSIKLEGELSLDAIN